MNNAEQEQEDIDTRCHALTMAVESLKTRDSVANASEVLETARLYEAYINGKADKKGSVLSLVRDKE